MDDSEDKIGAGIDFTDPNSPLAPLYFRTSTVVALSIIAFITLLYSHQPLHHTDVWGHLRHGQEIAEKWTFVGPDPISQFTDRKAQRPVFYWLTQLSYYYVFQSGTQLAHGDEAGGVELLRAWHVAAIAMLYLLWWMVFRWRTGSGLLAIIGLILLYAAAVSTIGIHRPQLFALVWFAAIVFLLTRPTLPWHTLASISAIMILWVNTHGSFLVGWGFIAVMLAGRALEVMIREGRSQLLRDRNLRILAFCLILGLASTVINPIGFRAFEQISTFASHPNLKTMLEWMPLDFSKSKGGHILYIAIWVYLIVCQIFSPKLSSPTQLLLCISFGIAPLIQERMMAWWIPLAIMIGLDHLKAIMDRRNWQIPESVPSLKRTVLTLVIAFFCFMLSPLMNWIQSEHPAPLLEVVNAATPIELASALPGSTTPTSKRFQVVTPELAPWVNADGFGSIFCSESVGEYLYWRGYPVLMYTHAHLFTPKHYQACLAVKLAKPGCWEFLDRMNTNLIAIECYSSEGELLPLLDAVASRAEWKVIVDERNSNSVDLPDRRARMFVAVRRKPMQ